MCQVPIRNFTTLYMLIAWILGCGNNAKFTLVQRQECPIVRISANLQIMNETVSSKPLKQANMSTKTSVLVLQCLRKEHPQIHPNRNIIETSRRRNYIIYQK